MLPESDCMHVVKRLIIPAGIYDVMKSKLEAQSKSLSFLIKHVYILHLLYTRLQMNEDDYDSDGVRINAQRMKVLMGDDKATVFTNLLDWGYIVFFRPYKGGEKSTGYKLHHDYAYREAQIVKYKSNDSALIKKILSPKKTKTVEDKFLKEQELMLKTRLTISREGLDFIKKKYPEDDVQLLVDRYSEGLGVSDCEINTLIQPSDIILFSFLTRSFSASRPREDSRIYTPLSTLKKEYRQFLHLDGKPICGTDMSNSQILFSVAVIMQKLKTKKYQRLTDKSFLLYKELAQAGRFYPFLAAQCGMVYNESTKSEIKEKIFRDIIFSKPSNRKTKIKTAFITQFPDIMNTINLIKATAYNQFALDLQMMEASVMLKTVAWLNKHGIPAMSIHDSIVLNEPKNISIAEKKANDLLWQKYKLKATFKPETIYEYPSIERGYHPNLLWLKKRFPKGKIVYNTFRLYQFVISPNLKVIYRYGSYKYKQSNIEHLLQKNEEMRTPELLQAFLQVVDDLEKHQNSMTAWRKSKDEIIQLFLKVCDELTKEKLK